MSRQIHQYAIQGHNHYIIYCTGIDGYVSHFFDSKEGVARYATVNVTVSADERMSYEEWLERTAKPAERVGEIGSDARREVFGVVEKLIHGDRITLDEAKKVTSLESFVDAYLRGKDDSVSPVSEQECEAWIESIDKAIRSNYDSKWDARSIVNDAGWISYRTRANHATSPYASFLTKEDSEKFKKEQQDNSTENLRKIAGLYLKSLFSVAEKKGIWKMLATLEKKTS